MDIHVQCEHVLYLDVYCPVLSCIVVHFMSMCNVCIVQELVIKNFTAMYNSLYMINKEHHKKNVINKDLEEANLVQRGILADSVNKKHNQTFTTGKFSKQRKNYRV